MPLRVECYAGYRGEQEPRRFYPGEQGIEVVEILDRWLAPDHRYFKVRGDDGGVHILRVSTETGLWERTVVESGPRGS